MNLPPDSNSIPDELPLRHRRSREREAEKIRQEFVRSQRERIFMDDERPAQELTRDES